MGKLADVFLKKLAFCLEEEESDLYTMTLYTLDSDDLNYFRGEDLTRVAQIFRTLAEDTRLHAAMLKLILEAG